MNERKLKKILQEASTIECPYNVTSELRNAYSVSRAIDNFLITEYFPKQKILTEAQKLRKLRKILRVYESDVLARLLEVKENFTEIREKTKPNNQNLFLMAGTKKFKLRYI